MLLLNVYSSKQKLKKQSLLNRHKKLLVTGVTLVFLFGGLGVWYLQSQNNDSPAPTPNGQQTINYAPATESEKKENQSNKDRIVEEQQNQTSDPTNPSQKKTVSPTITNASMSGINAYVSGIFEEGGNCTATFTKDAMTLTKSSIGFQNASYTQCAPIDISGGFLSSGKWSVKVTYSSAQAEGTSAATTFEVQ